jgi:hypothetical protein
MAAPSLLFCFSFLSTHSSGHRLVHFEFGQDRLTQPRPLNTFELAQGAVKEQKSKNGLSRG